MPFTKDVLGTNAPPCTFSVILLFFLVLSEFLQAVHERVRKTLSSVIIFFLQRSPLWIQWASFRHADCPLFCKISRIFTPRTHPSQSREALVAALKEGKSTMIKFNGRRTNFSSSSHPCIGAALICPCNHGDGRWRPPLGAARPQRAPTCVFPVWLEDVWDAYGQFNHSKFKLNAPCKCFLPGL